LDPSSCPTKCSSFLKNKPADINFSPSSLHHLIASDSHWDLSSSWQKNQA
jgi:hypothetical protein